MIYLDTSALLKRYITEPESDAFDEFFLAHLPHAISRLTFVEMRCALARRRRAGEILPQLEQAAMEELRNDMQDGALVLHALADGHVAAAYHLIGEVADIPLRTLDAIHLAIARELGAKGFASADFKQAEAAGRLGFSVYPFISEKTS
jgi:predicted nucleic acid-binding protein